MKSEWILDVLEELKGYARSNEMDILAEQLADVSIVALAEINSKNHYTEKADTYGQSGLEPF